MSPQAQRVRKLKAGVAMATDPRTTGATTATRPAGLRRDAIGLPEVLFQSITDMGRLSRAESAVTLEVPRPRHQCLPGAFSVNSPENAPRRPGAGAGTPGTARE
jgi:hypothetical protein